AWGRERVSGGVGAQNTRSYVRSPDGARRNSRLYGDWSQVSARNCASPPDTGRRNCGLRSSALSRPASVRVAACSAQVASSKLTESATVWVSACRDYETTHKQNTSGRPAGVTAAT